MTTPTNYTKPDWWPLERTVRAMGLPIATCFEFMWMFEESPGVHAYKHCDTRRYARLTADIYLEAEACDQVARARSLGGTHS
jgi:hypothetical protein